MKATKFALLIGAALVAAVAATGAQAEPLKIRLHWAQTPGHWAPLIPLFPKSVEIHYGKSYVLEPLFMRGSGPAMQALAAGGMVVLASFAGLA